MEDQKTHKKKGKRRKQREEGCVDSDSQDWDGLLCESQIMGNEAMKERDKYM